MPDNNSNDDDDDYSNKKCKNNNNKDKIAKQTVTELLRKTFCFTATQTETFARLFITQLI